METEQTSTMNEDKSPGIYGIPTNICIETTKQLVIPLMIMFKFSLKRSTVPDEWKEAEIIFKRGSRNKPQNYRPVRQVVRNLI